VDLTAIAAALAATGGEDSRTPKGDGSLRARLEQELTATKARIAALEKNNRELHSRLAKIAALAASDVRASVDTADIAAEPQPKIPLAKPVRTLGAAPPAPATSSGNGIHPAARKLLTALAQHAPARFTWGQAATLAGLKPSGGHFNSGRKDLRSAGYVAETNGLVTPTLDGLKAAGDVPPAPSTPADRLALWCGRLPAPAPGERWLKFILDNFNVVFGVPSAVVASLAVVILLQTNSRGSLRIKMFSGFELSGPSVPITLWVACFLSIISSIHLLSK
jgi:hypothetical protein